MSPAEQLATAFHTWFGFDRFGSPVYLYALALIPIIAGLMYQSARSGGPTVVHGAGYRLAKISPTLRTRLRLLPAVVRLAVLALLVLTLARPENVSGRQETKTEGVALQLVIDRSGSMEERIAFEGQAMRRIDAVKEVVARFIAGEPDDNTAKLTGRQGDLIGLIVFGSFADTLAPLTRDHTPLLEILEPLDVARARTESGTAIGDAVALGVARLKNAETRYAERADEESDEPRDESFTIKSKALILLTDGQSNRGQVLPISAAQFAAENEVKIYAIGIGSPNASGGGFFRAMSRQVDEATLREMARLTGGRYWLADTGEALREIYAEIDQLETTEIETSEYTERETRYRVFALPAFTLLGLETLLRALIFRRVP